MLGMVDHDADVALSAARVAGCESAVAAVSSDSSFGGSLVDVVCAFDMALRKAMIHRSLSKSVPAARKTSLWKFSPFILKTHLPVDLLAAHSTNVS